MTPYHVLGAALVLVGFGLTIFGDYKNGQHGKRNRGKSGGSDGSGNYRGSGSNDSTVHGDRVTNVTQLPEPKTKGGKNDFAGNVSETVQHSDGDQSANSGGDQPDSNGSPDCET